MAKYKYRLEMQMENGEWFIPTGFGDEQRGFLLGYLYGRYDAPPPRLAMRVIRSDGKIADERPANDEDSIGMIAGWPTAEQYESAAKRALEKAERIRKMTGNEK